MFPDAFKDGQFLVDAGTIGELVDVGQANLFVRVNGTMQRGKGKFESREKEVMVDPKHVIVLVDAREDRLGPGRTAAPYDIGDDIDDYTGHWFVVMRPIEGADVGTMLQVSTVGSTALDLRAAGGDIGLYDVDIDTFADWVSTGALQYVGGGDPFGKKQSAQPRRGQIQLTERRLNAVYQIFEMHVEDADGIDEDTGDGNDTLASRASTPSRTSFSFSFSRVSWPAAAVRNRAPRGGRNLSCKTRRCGVWCVRRWGCRQSTYRRRRRWPSSRCGAVS
jgi:hypothetical protein